MKYEGIIKNLKINIRKINIKINVYTEQIGHKVWICTIHSSVLCTTIHGSCVSKGAKYKFANNPWIALRKQLIVVVLTPGSLAGPVQE